MCFSSGNTVTQTQTTKPPKYIQQAQQGVISQAQEAAAAPFQQPAQPVAPLNPFQTQAFNQVQNMQGMTDPYFAQAGQSITEAGTPITQDEIQSYLNPYGDAALANMKKYIFDPQRVQGMALSRGRAGGPSADRIALTSQNLDFTQADALSQALSGFYTPAMQQAQRAKEMALQSGQSYANLGVGAQNAALTATNALGQAGNQQQAQTQAELMSPYQQELARLAYPFQTAQFMSGITAQQAPGAGGTTTGTTTYPTPSVGNQILGLGTAAAGALMGMPSTGGIGKGSTPNYGQSYNIGYGGQQMPVFRQGGRAYAEGGAVDDTQNWINAGFRMAQSAAGGDHMDIGGTPSWPPTIPNPGSIPPGMLPQSWGVGRAPISLGFPNKHYTGNMTSPMMPRGGPGWGRGPNSSGGPVNPFHMGEGFDFGGPVIDADYTAGDSSPIDTFSDRFQTTALSPNRNVDVRFGQGAAGSMGSNEAIKSAIDKGQAYFQERQEGPLLPPELHGKVYGNAPPPPAEPQVAEGPVERPQITIPPGVRPLPPQRMRDPSVDLDRLMLPQGRTPYPDALNRDWGQKAVRSPWMALVEAGAKMAQTTGPIGSAIGAGIQTGSKALTDQRKELRGEEAINQRAQDLYRHAQSELRRYQQNKFQQMPYTTGEGHPVAFDVGKGRAYDTITGEPIVPGVPLSQTSRSSAGRPPAMVATAEWMVKNGISPDATSAFNRLKEAASDKARADSLIKEYTKMFVQGEFLSVAEAKRKAEELLRRATQPSENP